MKTLDELHQAIAVFEYQRTDASVTLSTILSELNQLWDYCEGKTPTCPYTEMEIRNFMKFLYEELKARNFESINQPILEMEHVLGAALHKLEGNYKTKADRVSANTKPAAAKQPPKTDMSKLVGKMTDEEMEALKALLKSL